MRTFTLDRWAQVAGLPLAAVTVFTDDLVEMELAEHVGGSVYGLTARGERVLDALARIPLQESAR